ncbi:MAG: mitochondrial fission ELM1 family protein [Planctomyces sp.]
MSASDTAVVWRFLDGRTGHENQVLALSEAIARRRNCRFYDVSVNSAPNSLNCSATKTPGCWHSLPAPQLLIGAGHRTHLPMLLARYRFGGKAVVLMKPTLPCHFFDACLIPHHDSVWITHAGVLRTSGVLHRVRPANGLCPRTGLMLIGGNSRHFDWDSRTVARQAQRIIEQNSAQWTIATSRRTPPDFLQLLHEHPATAALSAGILPASELLSLMNTAGRIAVTCDSMSMISESLSSGAAVSLIRMPLRKSSRISRELCRLIRAGRFLEQSTEQLTLTLPAQNPVSESDRCAAFLDQLLPSLPEIRTQTAPYPAALSGAPA